jgi:hypothetical protein
MTMSDDKKKLIKVTATWYYEPDLSQGGGYGEWMGEGRYQQLASTIEQAAAYDLNNYRENHFGLEEYIGFAVDSDFDLKAEVVEMQTTPLGDIEVVTYTVPNLHGHEESEMEYYKEFKED